MATVKVLLLDIGNRQLKTKLGDDCHAFDWRSDVALNDFEEYLRAVSFDILVYACSAPQVEAQVLDAINAYPSEKILEKHIALNVVSGNTGVDRLLAGFAASKMASAPVIVVDLGTAFTVDVVDARNHFRGGAIGLGLGSQLSALAQAVPHLESPVESRDVVPSSTEAAVFDGTYRALAFAIRGLVEHYQVAGVENATVFVCGGDAHRMRTLLPDYRFEDQLLFDGMHLVVADNWL
ncbi:MAG: type III pantothenate kinase [Planctomycetota bacterium]|nr:type III pantothenate kinase [Planctomycetota bacterium]